MKFNPVSKMPKVFYAEITPTEAQEILEKHNTDPENGESSNYRRLRNQRTEKYAADIRHKRWVPGIATIDFDVDGILLNGQHTLDGCIKGGRPITVTVRTGLPTEAVQALDAGLPRTEGDAMKQPAVFVAIGRWIFEPSESPKVMGRLDMIAFYEKHREAIEFVLQHTPSARGIRIGPVLAPAARAYYTQDRVKIAQFLKILGSNQADGSNSNLVLAHGSWLQKEAVRGARRIAAYWRTEKVLWNYLNNRSPRSIVISGKVEEMFPMPAEQRRQTTAAEARA